MSLDYQLVKNWPIGKSEQRYTRKDTMLYALGVGAAMANPLAPEDLKFVFERRLQALPTFAALLAGNADWMSDPQVGIELDMVLHGEQFLTMHQVLPVSGAVVAVGLTGVGIIRLV